MQQIVERENAPKETEETAREVGGSPGPSSSLELREEQGWEEQKADGRTTPQSQGLLWPRAGEERKDPILSGKQISGGLD